MPLYEYRCEKCGVDVEKMVPTEHRDNALHACGSILRRALSLPHGVIKQTGKEMALNALNSKQTAHMKPIAKAMAAQGYQPKEKVLF